MKANSESKPVDLESFVLFIKIEFYVFYLKFKLSALIWFLIFVNVNKFYCSKTLKKIINSTVIRIFAKISFSLICWPELTPRFDAVK